MDPFEVLDRRPDAANDGFPFYRIFVGSKICAELVTPARNLLFASREGGIPQIEQPSLEGFCCRRNLLTAGPRRRQHHSRNRGGLRKDELDEDLGGITLGQDGDRVGEDGAVPGKLTARLLRTMIDPADIFGDIDASVLADGGQDALPATTSSFISRCFRNT
jgi:hypothetical protein